MVHRTFRIPSYSYIAISVIVVGSIHPGYRYSWGFNNCAEFCIRINRSRALSPRRCMDSCADHESMQTVRSLSIHMLN